MIDADLDASDARDTATVEITTDLGDKETVKLEETLTHSGIFTGSLQLKPVDKPTPGNLDLAEPAIESYFGDNVWVRYIDQAASTETRHVGAEGDAAGRRRHRRPGGGVQQDVQRREPGGRDAVPHRRKLLRAVQEPQGACSAKTRSETDLEAGRRVLREVMEDYPDPKYVPRIAYLLGQFAQELAQWDEAIRSYHMILRQYPDNTLAPDAQYKLAQCYEEAGDFDEALEAYVTLAATYPKSPLIANVMIRICDYFYKNEKYEVAAQVGEKFLERFEGHQ